MAQGYRHLDHTEQQEISDSHRLATLRYNTAVPKLRCARRVAEGNLQFLLLAPEQVARDDVVEQLGRAPPALLVVDEAHCISEWGHDFRPDYLALGAAADAMGRPRVLALTATAAPPVREEIATRLGMHDPHTVVGDTDRPQLHLSVRLWHDEQAKWDAVAAEVAARHSTRDSSGIVYVTTRRHAEQFAQRLSDEGGAYRQLSRRVATRRAR
ncbi:MAG: DEAD/DEAH box helicase [Pseudonocardiaceae bacterium]